jgi:hypothetical protein
MGEDAVRDRLRAIAAALTAIRGRLEELSSALPEEEAEGEESGPGLRSIISCVLTDSLDIAILDLLRAAEQEPAPPARPGRAEGRTYGAVMSRLDRELPRRLAERERERREAEELFLDLATADGAGRAAALEEERFHRTLVVDRLLEEAASALPDDPGRSAELAGLAATVAGHLADVVDAMDGRARAACRLAHARRLAGDLAGAEQALAEAALCPGDTEVQAELCRALALVRWEQGRTEEAAALLDRAAALWAEEAVLHEEGACRVLRALLLVEEGKAADVVGLLRDELPLLADPWLALYGRLALALGLAERGLDPRARAMRDEGVALVHRLPPAAHLYALRLKGEIAACLCEHTTAEDLFDELRREALECRWLPEAAVATLALACLDEERGEDREAARARAAELAATFGDAEGVDGVLAALREFPAAIADPRELAVPLAATLLRLLRLRGVRSAPLPFA